MVEGVSDVNVDCLFVFKPIFSFSKTISPYFPFTGRQKFTVPSHHQQTLYQQRACFTLTVTTR